MQSHAAADPHPASPDGEEAEVAADPHEAEPEPKVKAKLRFHRRSRASSARV